MCIPHCRSDHLSFQARMSKERMVPALLLVTGSSPILGLCYWVVAVVQCGLQFLLVRWCTLYFTIVVHVKAALASTSKCIWSKEYIVIPRLYTYLERAVNCSYRDQPIHVEGSQGTGTAVRRFRLCNRSFWYCYIIEPPELTFFQINHNLKIMIFYCKFMVPIPFYIMLRAPR